MHVVSVSLESETRHVLFFPQILSLFLWLELIVSVNAARSFQHQTWQEACTLFVPMAKKGQAPKAKAKTKSKAAPKSQPRVAAPETPKSTEKKEDQDNNKMEDAPATHPPEESSGSVPLPAGEQSALLTSLKYQLQSKKSSPSHKETAQQLLTQYQQGNRQEKWKILSSLKANGLKSLAWAHTTSETEKKEDESISSTQEAMLTQSRILQINGLTMRDLSESEADELLEELLTEAETLYSYERNLVQHPRNSMLNRWLYKWAKGKVDMEKNSSTSEWTSQAALNKGKLPMLLDQGEKKEVDPTTESYRDFVALGNQVRKKKDGLSRALDNFEDLKIHIEQSTLEDAARRKESLEAAGEAAKTKLAELRAYMASCPTKKKTDDCTEEVKKRSAVSADVGQALDILSGELELCKKFRKKWRLRVVLIAWKLRLCPNGWKACLPFWPTRWLCVKKRAFKQFCGNYVMHENHDNSDESDARYISPLFYAQVSWQGLPASNGNMSLSKEDVDERDCKRFRRETMDLFLENWLPATRVARLAERAQAAGAGGIKDVVAKATSTKPTRALMRLAKKRSQWPPEYRCTLPAKKVSSDDRIEAPICVMLPHEIAYAILMQESFDQAAFVQKQQDLLRERPDICLFLQRRNLKPQECMLMSLWNDGVPFNNNREHSLEVWCCSLLADPHLKIPLTAWPKDLQRKQETSESFFNLMSWSFRNAFAQQMPLLRDDGNEFLGNDIWRKKRAGAKIPLKAILCDMKGDWAMFKAVIGVPAWNSATTICFKCNATLQSLHDVDLQAHWRTCACFWFFLLNIFIFKYCQDRAPQQQGISRETVGWRQGNQHVFPNPLCLDTHTEGRLFARVRPWLHARLPWIPLLGDNNAPHEWAWTFPRRALQCFFPGICHSFLQGKRSG